MSTHKDFNLTVFQKLLNLDEEIATARIPPIIVNDLPNETEADLDKIFSMVTTQYFGDKISMLPSCHCGFLRMQSLVNDLCPKCNTPVQSSIENDIQSLLWFRKPKEIFKLMSPIVFTMLRDRFTKQGWDVIHWLIDPTYKPQVRMTTFMAKIMDENFGRGWNNFISKFEQIFHFLLRLNDFSVGRDEIDYLYYLWVYHKEKFFCEYLPLPNRAMFVFENTNVGIYRNAPTDKAMQYISIMLSIDRSIQPLSNKAKELRIANLMLRMAEYTEEYIKKELSPKAGQIRKHNIATKTIMSFRTVATSITRPWDYESIEIPWYVGLMTFRPMLINKLDRYGMSVNKAANMLLSHVGTWDPLLDRLLNEIQEEAVGGKLSFLYQRNPTLKQGAAQQMKAVIKKDPGDKTIGIPLATCKSPNLDFDGKVVAVAKPF